MRTAPGCLEVLNWSAKALVYWFTKFVNTWHPMWQTWLIRTGSKESGVIGKQQLLINLALVLYSWRLLTLTMDRTWTTVCFLYDKRMSMSIVVGPATNRHSPGYLAMHGSLSWLGCLGYPGCNGKHGDGPGEAWPTSTCSKKLVKCHELTTNIHQCLMVC